MDMLLSPIDALGLVEVIGFIPAVAAADAALKSANVRLLALYKVDAGIVTIAVTGDVGAVRAAIAAASEAAGRLGPVRAAHVIARLSAQAAAWLLPKAPPQAKRAGVSLRLGELMATIAQPYAPEVVDAEGRPALESLPPPTLAAQVTPADAPIAGAKRGKRKKTTAEDTPSES